LHKLITKKHRAEKVLIFSQFADTVDYLNAELKKRAALPRVERKPERGYARLYAQEILGADEGCDFAFLRPPARYGISDAGA
jgi:hypothetical protein